MAILVVPFKTITSRESENASVLRHSFILKYVEYLCVSIQTSELPCEVQKAHVFFSNV